MSKARVVASNTVWYALENLFSFAGAIAASVLVARHFGPERLGDFSYVSWLTSAAGTVGSFGLPTTAQTFIANAIGRDKRSEARTILVWTLKLQATIATVIAMLAVAGVLATIHSESRHAAILLALSILPRTISFIPSQVNSSLQRLKANLPGSLLAIAIQLLFTLSALWFGWGLVVIAAGTLVGCSVEAVLKLLSVYWVFGGERRVVLDRELRSQMVRFSLQGVGLLILNLVVWDRSDIVILKHFQPDPSQITFFSVPFTLLDRLMMMPMTLAGPFSSMIIAESGTGTKEVRRLVGLACSYTLAVSLPLLMGAAVVAAPFWAVAYGPAYAPAVPVFCTMALLAIPKSAGWVAQVMLRTNHKQDVLLWLSLSGGFINLAVDLLLVPRHGALGAAFGNGVAQLLMTLSTWVAVRTIFGTQPPLRAIAKLVLSAAVMAGCAWLPHMILPDLAASVTGVVVGMMVYPAMLRLTGALAPPDRERLLTAGRIMPKMLRNMFSRLIYAIIPDCATRDGAEQTYPD